MVVSENVEIMSRLNYANTRNVCINLGTKYLQGYIWVVQTLITYNNSAK